MSRLADLGCLSLSKNWLRPEGSTAVAQGCSRIPSLKQLHLGVAMGAPVHVVLQPIGDLLGEGVTVEMSGGRECNEWVMESWQVDD